MRWIIVPGVTGVCAGIAAEAAGIPTYSEEWWWFMGALLFAFALRKQRLEKEP